MFQWILNVHLGWEWRIFNHLFSIGIIHLGSTQNLPKKTTFLIPPYAHACVRMTGQEMLVFRKIFRTY